MEIAKKCRLSYKFNICRLLYLFFPLIIFLSFLFVLKALAFAVCAFLIYRIETVAKLNNHRVFAVNIYSHATIRGHSIFIIIIIIANTNILIFFLIKFSFAFIFCCAITCSSIKALIIFCFREIELKSRYSQRYTAIKNQYTNFNY